MAFYEFVCGCLIHQGGCRGGGDAVGRACWRDDGEVDSHVVSPFADIEKCPLGAHKWPGKTFFRFDGGTNEGEEFRHSAPADCCRAKSRRTVQEPAWRPCGSPSPPQCGRWMVLERKGAPLFQHRPARPSIGAKGFTRGDAEIHADMEIHESSE